MLPGIHMIARLDGRGFTRLTKETHRFEAPYDERFRDHMIGATRALFDAGFRARFGYTQSDEISLLIDANDDAFGRKLRKINSLLAATVSAHFSLSLGDLATFDCRVSQLPSTERVVDYFRWRSQDAHRNSLHGYAYWMLRREGKTANEATNQLTGMSASEKNELLFSRGINFNDLPTWHKRGVGVYWETYDKDGHNPVTGETTTTTRRRLKTDLELPMKAEFDAFIGAFVETNDV